MIRSLRFRPLILIGLSVVLSIHSAVSLAEDPSDPALVLQDRKTRRLIEIELSRRFSGAEIRIEEILSENGIPSPQSFTFVSENPQGTAHFEAADRTKFSVRFAAYQAALIPEARLLFGQKLAEGRVSPRELNVTSGSNRELRGLFLQPGTDLNAYQSRQTLLEGQPILKSGVEKIPEIKRGESVRVQVISAGMELSTTGKAEEPAGLGDSVRVMIQKTKKVLTGKLKEGRVVEVQL